MKRNFAFIMAIAALAMLLSSTGPVFACWGTAGFKLAGDFKEPDCAPVTLSTGGDLWTLLQDTCGGVMGSIYDPVNHYPPEFLINPTNHNWADGDYVLVTGKDGIGALYSMGELDPKFAPANAVTLTCDRKGRCDLAGMARVVRNVSNIDVVHAVDTVKVGTRTYTQQLIVSGAGITPRIYNLADLEGMTQVTYTGTVQAKGATYTGPTLRSILKDAGIDTRDMNSYIVVNGPDGYGTLLSMYEATHQSSTEGGVPEYPLLAISASNTSINCWITDPATCTKEKDNGFARLVLPGDKVWGRWTSNVYQIVVFKLDGKESCKGYWCK
ncbi:MAG: hypothetical protein ABFD97_18470 [Syntrophobacter sp.]